MATHAQAEDVLGMLFLARVVAARSFTGAAASLGVSKSVVSARIAQLETRLGTRLLQRTTRRLSLTQDGLAVYERAARMTAEADEAANLAQGASPTPRGLLRVNAPVAFAERHLVAPVATYLARYPDVRVELLLSDRTVDLVEEGIDVAIRVSARLRDSSLVARKLADDRTLVCAAPAYLERRGVPAAPADLLAHDCLRYALLQASDEWRFRAPGQARGSFAVPVEGRFLAASGALLRAAALAGAGLAVLPSFMVADELRDGRLRVVLADYSYVRLGVHAVYSPAGAVPARVRAFVDVMTAALRTPAWAAAAPAATVPPARTSRRRFRPAPV
jgi:DNA-binding transcriptional LysR family regulator